MSRRLVLCVLLLGSLVPELGLVQLMCGPSSSSPAWCCFPPLVWVSLLSPFPSWVMRHYYLVILGGAASLIGFWVADGSSSTTGALCPAACVVCPLSLFLSLTFAMVSSLLGDAAFHPGSFVWCRFLSVVLFPSVFGSGCCWEVLLPRSLFFLEARGRGSCFTPSFFRVVLLSILLPYGWCPPSFFGWCCVIDRLLGASQFGRSKKTGYDGPPFLDEDLLLSVGGPLFGGPHTGPGRPHTTPRDHTHTLVDHTHFLGVGRREEGGRTKKKVEGVGRYDVLFVLFGPFWKIQK